MNRLGLILLSILFVTLITACGQSGSTDNANSDSDNESNTSTNIRLGTSTSGSAFYGVAIAMSKLISEDTDLNVAVETVGGSDANVNVMRERKIELSMMNSITASNSRYSLGEYQDQEPLDVTLIAQGQPTLRQIVVRENSGIEKIEDLVGKNFNAIRPTNLEIEQIANAIFETYNISTEDVNMISVADTSDAIEGLETGSLDAAILPQGLNSSALTELAEQTDIRFISIDDDKMEEILEKLPDGIYKAIIPADTYNGQEEDVAVFGFNTYLTAHGNVDEETIFEATRGIFDNQEEFVELVKQASSWTLETTFDNPRIPFHPGAKRYFEEIGKWTDELEKEHQSLLE